MTIDGLLSLRECGRELKVSHSYLSKLKTEGQIQEYPIPGKKRGGYKLDEIKAVVETNFIKNKKTQEKNEDDIFSESMSTNKYLASLTPEELKERERLLAETKAIKEELKIDQEDMTDDTEEDIRDNLAKISLTEARTEKEYWLGKQAKAKYDKDKGEQISIKLVEQVLFDAGKTLRDVIMSTPAKIAPLLVSMTNRHDIEKLLEENMARALRESSRVIESDLLGKQK